MMMLVRLTQKFEEDFKKWLFEFCGERHPRTSKLIPVRTMNSEAYSDVREEFNVETKITSGLIAGVIPTVTMNQYFILPDAADKYHDFEIKPEHFEIVIKSPWNTDCYKPLNIVVEHKNHNIPSAEVKING
jgi:hypothetical protein